MTAATTGLITIALTSYNYAEFICEAISSVIEQTSPHWRLIIFDNHSTDNTIDVIQKYLSDERITLVRREYNIGQRNNLLRALEEINSEFVCTLQADDFLDRRFIETALTELADNNSAPFVIFNWHHYHQRRKKMVPNDSSPFADDRSGPLLIGPYLSVANFVPLHMAVFRREHLAESLSQLSASPITQLIEQFILTILEDRYGPGCFTGTYGGVWRRHETQLTSMHIASSISVIEEPIERLWYATHAPAGKTINIFLALVTFIRYASRVDYPTAVEWLLGRGKSFTESFGVSVSDNNIRLHQVALTVGLKFNSYSGINVINRDQLLKWMSALGEPRNEAGLINILGQVAQSEGDLFIRQDEISHIVRFFDMNTPPGWLYTIKRKLNRFRKRPLT